MWTKSQGKGTRTRREAPDRLIFWVATALLGCGAVLVFSASAHLADTRYGGPLFFLLKQSIFFCCGLTVLLGLSRVPYTFWQRTYRWWLLGALLLMMVVLFAPAVRGARRWLSLGLFSVQPSEAFRFAVILFMAATLSRRRRGEDGFKRRVLPHLVLLAAGGVLLMLQPDFGSLLVLGGTVMILLFLAGTPMRQLAAITLPAVLLCGLIVFGFGYKKERFDNYIEGVRDPFAAGYQVRQAMIHVGAGGVTGVGLGDGMAKYFHVPDAHTDFILASAGEELGLVATLAIISAYTLLMLRGLRVAARAPDRFSSLLVAGLITSLGIQIAVNISVVLGLLPPTGLPLPLLSYGGSSVLFTTASLALVLNVSRHVRA